ncbi:MAG: tRNA preQ1(34) S-adenosylmethionine ribosyltransferase-isomerase QueA [Acidobacteriaceae bacterium]
MRVSDFHFDLPEELIAQHPPAERGSSRMLVLRRDAGGAGEATLEDATFRDLPRLLNPGDLLVLNNSRVLPARLYGRRVGASPREGPQPSSGAVEVLLVEGGPGDSADARDGVWKALVKPGRKVRVGTRLEFFAAGGEAAGKGIPRPVLTAEVVGAGEFGERTLRFAPVEDFHAALERVGHMPLPPYIRREHAKGPDAAEDLMRYQTVYARQAGSAAAPTAGLHFTPEILEALRARGVEIAYLTLHVGLGTFQPVRVAELADIRLHSERYTLPPATSDALNRARREGRRVIAVGTTTTRTLEHIALQAEGQTEAQAGAQAGAQADADAEAAAGTARGGQFEAHSGSTAIFLSPGHRFRVVSGLLTNFHLPESTLLMLVAAFAGCGGEDGRRAILAAYAHAIRGGYRFYSYGDCMLLL